MTETTTPTEEVVDTSTGSPSDLPEDTTNDSAVEQVDDTASEETTEPGSNDSTTEEEPNQVSADLKRFAKGQGYTDEDIESMSPREAKTLSAMQKKVSAERKQMQSEARGGLEKTVKTVKGDEMSDRDYFEFRMQQRDMVDDIRNYWDDNPDDRQYEAEAVAILQKEQEQYGEEAMLRLAGNMPRLVREAKYAAGAFDTSSATEQGRKEERERLRKQQEGAADGMDARTNETPDQAKDDAEFLKSYDPSDPEQRKRADKILAEVSKGRFY